MRARVKATGENVEVDQCSILYDDGRRELMYGKELEEVQGAPDYWEKLKHQYAGMAMQGILSNPESELDFKDDETLPQALAGCAAKIATALVEKLKSESNGKQEDKEQQAESRYPFGDTSSGHETNESDRIV